MVFLGFVISFVYSVLGSILVYLIEGKPQAQLFLTAYNSSFNTLISLGLILGTALVVFSSQSVVPEVIESAFASDELAKSDYFLYKQRFASLTRSVNLATEFAVAGFVLFFFCQFPLGGLAESLMVVASCLQYALGVYVLRKLTYAGLMLHSLLGIQVTRNLRRARELDMAHAFIFIGSALTVASGYAHTVGYFRGPFLFQRFPGEGIKIILIFPALIAGPILALLVFHSLGVLKSVYHRSVRTKKSATAKANLIELPPFQSPEAQISAPTKRFRVALSFAGEKRDFVAKVAALLVARFGETAILYDKFHEAEFARRDLGFYLPDLYHRESDLVVVVVCSNYEAKEWCGLEWDAIFDLLKKRKNEEIMLCRFDHALIRGMYSTAGFLELDDLSAEQTTTRILERLALNEGKPKSFYLSGAPRPE